MLDCLLAGSVPERCAANTKIIWHLTQPRPEIFVRILSEAAVNALACCGPQGHCSDDKVLTLMLKSAICSIAGIHASRCILLIMSISFHESSSWTSTSHTHKLVSPVSSVMISSANYDRFLHPRMLPMLKLSDDVLCLVLNFYTNVTCR